jgi:hypothetical protein
MSFLRQAQDRSEQPKGAKNLVPGWQFVTVNEILSFGFVQDKLASLLRTTNAVVVLGQWLNDMETKKKSAGSLLRSF